MIVREPVFAGVKREHRCNELKFYDMVTKKNTQMGSLSVSIFVCVAHKLHYATYVIMLTRYTKLSNIFVRCYA